MNSMRLLAKLIIAPLLTIGITTAATADESEGATINLGTGYLGFDSDRNFDSSMLGNIGIGYRFASPWAIELAYLNGDTELENTGTDVDADYFRLDGLYHLETKHKITPFFAFGVGRADFDSPVNSNGESLINAGFGAKYWFQDKTAFRGDVRAFRTSDSSDIDTAFILSLHHSFSESKPAPAPAGPLDTDGDGVTDDMDACPRTPANTSVDSRGCALDTDGDGVPDYKDACPGTDLAGARIDSRGCYEMLKETVSVKLNVLFDFDSAATRPSHRAEVERVYKFMKEYPQTKVTIEGHTDSQGNAEYNKGLSQRRANTIAGILTNDFGIEERRVTAKGYGEERPVTDNSTKASRQENRRVVGVVEANVEKIKKN